MTQIRCMHIQRSKVTWKENERKHFDAQDLAQLAETVKANGILQPIGVTETTGQYVGVWGQRRWKAAELAGIEEIPAIVLPQGAGEETVREMRLIENLCRVGLRPIEEAVGLDEYIKAGGISASEAARRLGMKPAAMSRSLTLLKLSEPLRRQVDEGVISPAAGYELARVENPALQAELAAKVASGELRRDGLVSAIKASRRSRPSNATGKHCSATARLGGGRQVTVRAGALSVEAFIATLEDLLGRCRAARTKGLSLRTLLKVLADEASRTSGSEA